jgi:hypothetical protein
MVGRRDDNERRDEAGSLRVRWDLVTIVIGWIVTVVLAYGAIDKRVSVLEAGAIRAGSDITEIKADVKTLIQRGGH